MKIHLLFLFSFFSGLSGLVAQEFESWNAADFDLSRKELNRSLEDFDFGFEKSNFNLPSGKFLNVDQNKRNGVDIVALIDEKNNYRQRTVDIGSPLPKKERKDFELSTQTRLYKRAEVENEALNSNPYYRNQRIYQNALHNSAVRSMYGRRSFYSPYGRYY
ncbi:MAG TPA: hypothetical protein VIM94_11205 [Salegentibacter sp.]|uniref:hypothetical protein n=1 Tax=Salegentibacter sp. TaxID=1903072 RepID=UPI002F95507F